MAAFENLTVEGASLRSQWCWQFLYDLSCIQFVWHSKAIYQSILYSFNMKEIANLFPWVIHIASTALKFFFYYRLYTHKLNYFCSFSNWTVIGQILPGKFPPEHFPLRYFPPRLFPPLIFPTRKLEILLFCRSFQCKYSCWFFLSFWSINSLVVNYPSLLRSNPDETTPWQNAELQPEGSNVLSNAVTGKTFR